MTTPASLRINSADLAHATPQGLRLLAQLCEPRHPQQERAPERRKQSRPSTNQRKREGR